MNGAKGSAHVDHPRGRVTVRPQRHRARCTPLPLGPCQPGPCLLAVRTDHGRRDGVQRALGEGGDGRAVAPRVHRKARRSQAWRAWEAQQACRAMDRGGVTRVHRETRGSAPGALADSASSRSGSAPGAVAVVHLVHAEVVNSHVGRVRARVRALPRARRSLRSLTALRHPLIINHLRRAACGTTEREAL